MVATGSNPVILNFPGEQKPVAAEEILMDKVQAGENVVVVGGGLVGCETGLMLAQKGKHVTILEMMPAILGGHGVVPPMNQFMLEDLLTYNKVQIHTSTVIDNTFADHVTVKSGDKVWDVPCDTLITCVGYRANNALYNELAKESMVPLYNIGDSNKVRNIMAAIWDAYELGRNL